MTNKKVIIKKTLIASCLFICATLTLGTIFWKMNGSESNDWILYIQEWIFPVLIFITLPFTFGMWNTSSSDSSFPSLWAKLLTNTITYVLVLFAIVWAYSEPKPLDMEAYKYGCLFLLPSTCGICIIGHYTDKIIWRRWSKKNLKKILDNNKKMEKIERMEKRNRTK